MDIKYFRIGNYIQDFETDEKEFQIEEIRKYVGFENWAYYRNGSIKSKDLEPIPITKKKLLEFGFESWGKESLNDFEEFERFVLHNVVDGTSNFEVHRIKRNYDNISYIEFVCSIDKDERINYYKSVEFIHEIQNLFFINCGYELQK